MFLEDNLYFPLIALVSIAATAAAVSSIHSLALWHAQLDYAVTPPLGNLWLVVSGFI